MGKVIWTNHLYDRIRQRGLDPSWVDKAVRFPDKVERSTTTSSSKHTKYIQGYEITASVVRQGSDWIITSAWWNETNSSHRHTPKKSLIERLVYKFVVYLESKIKGRSR